MRRQRSSSPRRFEKLEDRQMMAADIDLDNGVLTVEGTTGDEMIFVETNPNDSGEVLVSIRKIGTGELLAEGDYDREDIDELVVNALDGNDHIYNRTDISARLYGGEGHDSITSESGNDLIDGGAGDDQLIGGQGNDQLFGGSGNDRYHFIGTQLGNDIVFENAGQDMDALDFIGLAGPVNLNLSTTAEQVVHPNHLRLRLSSESGIESITGSQFDDIIRGNSRDNFFMGMDGNDTLYGGLGNDGLHGINGNDTLYGEAGNDFLMGDAGDDAIWGGDGDDELRGWEGNDRLYGENGRDKLDGDNGDDLLDGGHDDLQDQLKGGVGRDQFVIHRWRYRRNILDQMLDYTHGVDAVFTVWH
jgi:Ca2+-binding RTX toxin-like protein